MLLGSIVCSGMEGLYTVVFCFFQADGVDRQAGKACVHQGASTMCLRLRAAMNSSQVYATSLQASYRSAALLYMSFCSPAHAHSQPRRRIRTTSVPANGAG